jgi:hypothetical protein
MQVRARPVVDVLPNHGWKEHLHGLLPSAPRRDDARQQQRGYPWIQGNSVAAWSGT